MMAVDTYFNRSIDLLSSTVYGQPDCTRFGATIAACDPQSWGGKNKRAAAHHAHQSRENIKRMTEAFIKNGGTIR